MSNEKKESGGDLSQPVVQMADTGYNTNELLQAFLENSPSVITLKDTQGRYVLANPAAKNAFDRPWEEVQGKTGSELFDQEVAAMVHKDDMDVIQNRKTVVVEYNLGEGENERHYVRYMFPLYNPGGEVSGVGTISNDVTLTRRREREVKESNDRFTSLFYNSPVSMLIANMQTSEYMMVNHAFLKTFGYTKEDIVGRKTADLQLMENEEERQKLRHDLLKTGKITNREFGVYHKSGELISCLSSIEIVKLGDELQSISAFQDISELKKVEERLEAAKMEAERATMSKSSFLANMSHEIRTPLNAMLGFAELLKSTSLTAIQKDYLESIDSSGKTLFSIINDILDFSKIEAGMLSLEKVPFSPQQALHSVYTMFFTRARQKGLKLFTSVDPRTPGLVIGDPTRFNQIMMNLIGNAVKFTNEGSIAIECTVNTQNGNRVELEFSVKDTGIGIEPGKLEQIFDRFTQAEENTTRNFGGTGLGLSIARKIIELQNGILTVKSKPGEGSEFTFTLEYEISNSLEYSVSHADHDGTGQSFEGKHALIVEDNPLNQKLASTLLAQQGFTVQIAQNGEIAIELLRAHTFDVVLMDIQMPVMDGYQATRKLRKELKLTLPVIAMTANALAGERERCIGEGMDDYLTKPFKVESLMNILHRHVFRDESKNEKKLPGRDFHLDRLRELAQNNSGLVKEVTEMFLAQNPMETKRLETAIAQKDLSAIRSVAHSLITSVGFFYTDTSYLEELRLIEKMIVENAPETEIAEKANELLAVCRKLQIELKDVLKTEQSS